MSEARRSWKEERADVLACVQELLSFEVSEVDRARQLELEKVAREHEHAVSRLQQAHRYILEGRHEGMRRRR